MPIGVSKTFTCLYIDVRRRYFAVAEEEGKEAESKQMSTAHPETIHSIVATAQKLIVEGKSSQAAEKLKDALNQNQGSKELWICYLKLKSQMSPSTQLPYLYRLFTQAVASSQSYAVILEVLYRTHNA